MSKADKSVPERPEQELIEAAKIGDRAAFEQLLDRHVRTVWRIAWRVLRHPQDAAEVTRDTFLAAHRTLPAFAGELRFSSWLERIAVGRAVKLLERQGERRHVTSTPLPEGQPVAALDAAEIARRGAAARMRLAGPQRAVLTLRDTDGRNWDEVEKILAAPHDAALQRLAHARLALRRAVTGRGETERGDQLALDLVSRYIDGDLDALDRAATERKLGAHPEAKALYEDFRTLKAACGRDEEPPVPAEIAQQIKDRLPSFDEAPRLRPPKPQSGVRATAGSEREFPLGKVVLGLVAVGVVIAAVFFAVEEGWGARLWERLIHGGAQTEAQEPATTTPPRASLDGSAAATEIPAGGLSRGPETTGAGTAAATQPSGAATTTTAATPPGAPQTSGAATAQPGATAPGAPPTTGAGTTQPGAGQPGAQPAPAGAAPSAQPAPVGQQTPSAAPQTPAAPQAPAVQSAANIEACRATWTAPGLAPWSSASPVDPALTLGQMAPRFQGKGYLIPQPRRIVKMIVPRDQYAPLVGSLRGLGVGAPAAAPPASSDCAAIVIDAPLPPAR